MGQPGQRQGVAAVYAGGGVNPPIRPARVWANAVTARSCRLGPTSTITVAVREKAV
jgi:hypothetical protein